MLSQLASVKASIWMDRLMCDENAINIFSQVSTADSLHRSCSRQRADGLQWVFHLQHLFRTEKLSSDDRPSVCTQFTHSWLGGWRRHNIRIHTGAFNGVYKAGIFPGKRSTEGLQERERAHDHLLFDFHGRWLGLNPDFWSLQRSRLFFGARVGLWISLHIYLFQV